MDGYYYSPFQYELRELLFEGGPKKGAALRKVGVPAPVVAGVGATALFLAYTPLFQPSPPAKTPVVGTLPIYQTGGPTGGMLV